MGIVSKQRKALPFLDTLGNNDRGDSVGLSATAQKLVDMSELLITDAQKNLNKEGSTSTGELEESIHAEDIQIDGSKMSVDILLLDRYKFTDKGVKGVESGTGKYSFKTKYPNKKMALALLKWYRTGRNASLSIRKPLAGKTEEKNIRLKKVVSDADRLKSLAYATAVNIKKHGIKPTYFFTNAIETVKRVYKKEIAAGFKIDIIESLKNESL